MAIRSVIDIEVNDEAFKKFKAVFDEYQKALNGLSSTHKKETSAIEDKEKAVRGVTKAVDEQTEAVDASTDAEERSVEAVKEHSSTVHNIVVNAQSYVAIAKTVGVEQEKTSREVERQARSWREMVRDVKTFAGHILDATRSLMRWAGITSLIGGILGVGGLFGIDRLAFAAGSMRRSALGLGVTPGEQSAFGLNYGRVVDPDRFLGGVNESLHDVTKRQALYGAGLTDRDIEGKDAAQVGALLIPALKRLADQTPENQLAQTLQARHLDQFLTLEDFQRLRRTPTGELDQYGRQYSADAKGLNLTQGQLKAWQDLQVQLSRAGQAIERTLISGLAGLAGPIGRLSDAFSRAIDDFAKSDVVRGWLDGLADGLKWLDDKIASKAFQDDVKTFIEDIGVLSKAIGAALHELAGWLSKSTTETPADGDSETSPGQPGWGYTPGKGFHKTPLQPQSYERDAPDEPLLRDAAYHLPATSEEDAYRPQGRLKATAERLAQAHDFFRRVGWSEAQTGGILDNLVSESGLNPAAYNPSGGGQGAQGIGQWRGVRVEAFRKLFGHDPASGTFEEQLMFVQWELLNTEKAAAARLAQARTRDEATVAVNDAYERSGVSGTGRVGVAGRPTGHGQYGDQFRDRSVRVRIDNNTGGNVTVSTTQLAT